MSLEQYWPAHKVFFVATLALFPDKLNGREVNPWFYKPYFAGKDLDFIAIELEDYKNLGYLVYEKSHGLFKISNLNVQKAANDLLIYLKKWQQDKLLSLSVGKPADADHQKVLLVNAIVRARANHQTEPQITMQDIYGELNNNTHRPTFWELVLSYQLLDRKVKIAYMDYSRREDGWYDDDAQPLVDLQVVDEELARLVEQQAALYIDSMPPTGPTDIVLVQPK